MRTLKIAAGILLGLFTAFASAQSAYPNRAIRMVVDTSPGGLTDILGRIAAEGLAQQLGRQVVVENKAGASGNVAIEFVVKSPADGYTLMICAGGNLVIKPFLEHSLAFDPLVDLVPVFNLAEAPHILVVPNSLAVRTSRSSSRTPDRILARSTTARREPAVRRTLPPINSRASRACSWCTCRTRAWGRRSPI